MNARRPQKRNENKDLTRLLTKTKTNDISFISRHSLIAHTVTGQNEDSYPPLTKMTQKIYDKAKSYRPAK
jgi:hypothetical protein